MAGGRVHRQCKILVCLYFREEILSIRYVLVSSSSEDRQRGQEEGRRSQLIQKGPADDPDACWGHGDTCWRCGDACWGCGTRVGHKDACLGHGEACWGCRDTSRGGGPRLGVQVRCPGGRTCRGAVMHEMGGCHRVPTMVTQPWGRT